MDDAELAIGLDLTDHDRLGHVVIAAHHDLEARRRLHLLTDHRLTDRLDIGGAGLLDRLHPHVEQDIGRLHWVVGDAFGIFGIGAPFRAERLVLRRVHGLRIYTGRPTPDR